MRFVVVAFVAVRRVIVEEADVRSEIVVVARLEFPRTVSVPCDVKDDVAVMEPPVIDEKIAVIPEMRLLKKLVEVALSKKALRTKRLVEVLFVVDAFSAMRVLLTVVLVVVKVSIVPADEVS